MYISLIQTHSILRFTLRRPKPGATFFHQEEMENSRLYEDDVCIYIVI